MRCTAVTDSDNGWNRATERIRLPADIYLCLEYLHLGIRRNIRILSYFMKGIKGTKCFKMEIVRRCCLNLFLRAFIRIEWEENAFGTSITDIER